MKILGNTALAALGSVMNYATASKLKQRREKHYLLLQKPHGSTLYLRAHREEINYHTNRENLAFILHHKGTRTIGTVTIRTRSASKTPELVRVVAMISGAVGILWSLWLARNNRISTTKKQPRKK